MPVDAAQHVAGAPLALWAAHVLAADRNAATGKRHISLAGDQSRAKRHRTLQRSSLALKFVIRIAVLSMPFLVW
jgi:hypothetical protein